MYILLCDHKIKLLADKKMKVLHKERKYELLFTSTLQSKMDSYRCIVQQLDNPLP